METNKTILLREIISLEDRGSVGTITDLLVDYAKKKVSHFCVRDAQTNTLSYLAPGSIVSAGHPYITIKNKSVLIPGNSTLTADIAKNEGSLLNIRMLSAQGDHVDFVKGFEFDPQSGEVSQLETYGSGMVAASSVLFFAKDYVCVDVDQSVGDSLDFSSAAAQQDELPVESAPAPAPEPPAQEKPEQASIDEELSELLIGAVVGEEVTSEDGAFSVSKGTVITEKLLAQAQEHDAVMLLTMSVDI